MKIYTKTGDQGETALWGGARVAKDHPRIEAYGTVDELNAALGMTRALGLPPELDAPLQEVQQRLFALGSELAMAGSEAAVAQVDVASLEQHIDHQDGRLPPLKQFILPAGVPAAAQLHVTRCVCRRAERRVVALAAQEDVSPTAIAYLNRLGDLLFVLARAVNVESGVPEIPWAREGQD